MQRLSKTLALALLFIFSSSAGAQTHSGSVRGTITDPNGAVIAGATVKAVNTSTNETRSTLSNDQGAYTMSSLAPGPYQIEVESPGFKRLVVTQISLQVNQELRLDGQLEVGEVNDSPGDLYASEPLLKQDSPSLGTVIEKRQVEGLPLDGRNFYELSLLVPGAVPPAQGSAGSVRGDFAFSVNGAREDSNNFLLDGVYNVDPKAQHLCRTPSSRCHTRI